MKVTLILIIIFTEIEPLLNFGTNLGLTGSTGLTVSIGIIFRPVSDAIAETNFETPHIYYIVV